MKDKDVENEVVKANEYLKQSGNSSNLYDCLSGLIGNALTERPKDAADLLENYINVTTKVKPEVIEDEEISKIHVAQKQVKLFEKANDDEYMEGRENEEEFEIPLPNCLQLAFFFEQAGIGLSREETYKIFLSLKELVLNFPLNSIRFWGKLFGTEANYYIVELEYRDGEGEEEENAVDEEPPVEQPLKEEEEEEEDSPKEEDDLPKSSWKPPPVIPKEDHHTGANKKVYFVCGEPGDAWIKLPHVTPEEITVSRQITKLLTGKLDAEITSYPPFPGEEINYLRAQIARISSSTQISPMGFFMFDDEEEEEEEEEAYMENYMENLDFEGLSLRELTDPSMSGWVHHTQHILPQGRCSWLNPFEKPEDDFEEEDFDEEEDENDNNIKPETGPRLLSSVADETAIETIPPWTTYVSSRVLPEYAVAVARSNRWPGAYAFARGKIFENLYIGWGQKYTGQSYAPPSPPPALEEYPDGPEITEMDDPTVEEEKALKERQEEALKEEEDLENFDDEDDDDD